jgi:hypothetical protein
MIAMTGASCAWVKTADPVANKAVVPRIAEAACSTRSGLTEPGAEVAKLLRVLKFLQNILLLCEAVLYRNGLNGGQ